ncbi:hypothetical protein [Epilithonimonas sp. UC225_85]|uniref:hypothetical protein n=1 Tax=Epilithonimonas sp. UC225_85 TaxID=3350167 RepID=UPI0036D396E0
MQKIFDNRKKKDFVNMIFMESWKLLILRNINYNKFQISTDSTEVRKCNSCCLVLTCIVETKG